MTASGAAHDSIRHVAVLGAGTMGHGIAQVAGMAGWSVALYDVEQAILERARERIETNLAGGVEKGKVEPDVAERALANLSTTTELAEAVGAADLVVEAVPEELALKREIFRKLDELCGDQAILATNTSSLSVGRIAEATARPASVVGMHFFNPVHIMKLVEVVRSPETADDVVKSACAAAEAMGKTPIVVKDSPGFASSRLGVALGLEAMRMVEEGVATPEAIDTAMELGYRHPMGPLRLSDLIGLDVRLSIAEYMYGETESPVFRPPGILERMVEEGRLGKKSGRGFYDWRQRDD